MSSKEIQKAKDNYFIAFSNLIDHMCKIIGVPRSFLYDGTVPTEFNYSAKDEI